MGTILVKSIPLALAMIWTSCSDKMKEGSSIRRTSKTTPYSAASGSTPTNPTDNDLVTEDGSIASEAVVPPGNVSGAYLICEDIANVVSTDPRVNVKCALRNQNDNQKLNLVNDFARYQWNAQNKAENFVDVSFIELADDPDWHVIYTLDGRNIADIQNFKNAKNLALDIEAIGGTRHKFASVPPKFTLRWQNVNGAPIPLNAIQAGTERKGIDSLFLCRSFVKNQVMPGKLVGIVAGDSRSSCFTADADTGQTSIELGTGRLSHFSEALVLENARFDETLEWVSAANGQHPSLAVLTGIDSAGAPSYTCRALSAVEGFNFPEGEMTPGQLRSGSDSCEYESFGAKKSKEYEVLAYKSIAVKTMFERIDQ